MKPTVRHITDNYPYDLLLQADETREGIDSYLFDSDVYVAEMPALVGVMCLLRLDDDTAELMNIAVDEPFRGRGIGGRMLDEAVLIAAEKGCRRLIVGTGTEDCAAGQIRFYERHGFRKSHLRENYFTKKYPEPIYEHGVQLRDMQVLERRILPSSEPLYFASRREWRAWLAENFETAGEVWFVFPNKCSGKTCVSYNDAVEEALCFGWIDSTVRALDREHKIQRFTPRRPRSAHSQSNKERLKWLKDNGLIHPKLLPEVERTLATPFVFPEDIIARLKEDPKVWGNYKNFSDSYKRLRVAYIEQARVRTDEFEKRLRNFIARTRDGKKVAGYGGIEKYY